MPSRSQLHFPETPAPLSYSEALYSILAVLHHHRLPCQRPRLSTLKRLPEV